MLVSSLDVYPDTCVINAAQDRLLVPKINFTKVQKQRYPITHQPSIILIRKVMLVWKRLHCIDEDKKATE
jgi:hypothetical protein